MADLHINKKTGWNAKWQQYEDDLIKQYYSFGAKEVHKYLPNRDIKSIQQRAFRLGIKYLEYNEHYFDVIDSPTKAYWLGFLYADGYVTSDDRWGLELCYDDLTHMQNFASCFDYNGQIKERTRNGNKSCLFQIKNKHMSKMLIDKGVIRNKTEILLFPTKEQLDEKYYSHFIRGFFDGDGCVYINHNIKPRKDRNNKVYDRISKGINIVCKSDSFVKSILSILEEENIHLNWNINTKHNNLNVIRTSSYSEIQKFYNYIYKNSIPSNRLERKYNKFNELFIATPNSDVRTKIS